MRIHRDAFGDHVSEGQRRLWWLCHRNGWSQNQLGRELGSAASVAHRILMGDVLPGLVYQSRLRDLGIDPVLFVKPPDPSEPWPTEELAAMAATKGAA